MTTMKEPLKYFIERTTPFGALARLQRERQLLKKYRRWQKDGAHGPLPNWGKQQVVIGYIKRFSPGVFVETGTYKGKMVYAVMPHIKEIYSIELDEPHFERARSRFGPYPNIHILQGQSGEILPKVLESIGAPCLFWLDAHWSGGSTARGDLETPIIQEIRCILSHPLANKHVILIDDARCFVGENDYPALEVLKQFIISVHPDWLFEVKDDIIRTYSDRVKQTLTRGSHIE